MKKKLKIILLLVILLILYIYTIAIGYLPDNIVLFEGEDLQIPSIFGLLFNIESESETLETSANTSNKISDKVGVTNMEVSLFNKLFIKEVEVSVLPKTKVIPVGNLAGVKLYTNGVLVVGMSEIQGMDNKLYKPYEKTGIEEGDTIISINSQTIHNTEDLIESVKNKRKMKERP